MATAAGIVDSTGSLGGTVFRDSSAPISLDVIGEGNLVPLFILAGSLFLEPFSFRPVLDASFCLHVMP
jgi:hypothetical protein